MISVKYIGRPQNIGRFGMVRKDQVIEVTIPEFTSLEGDPDFVECHDIDAKKIPVAAEPPKKFPKKCEGYDLRILPWGKPEFQSRLAKITKPDLLKILRSMKAAGCEVVADPDWTKEKLADSVSCAGIVAGWLPAPEPLKRAEQEHAA